MTKVIATRQLSTHSFEKPMLYPSLRSRETEASDALSLLTGCHARIRHFSRMAVALVESHGAPADEVAEAARQLVRYFTLALPLHVEDEELSLLPRLRGLGAELDARLETMRAEHERIDALLAPQVEAWQALAEAPGRLTTRAAALLPQARELHALFERHLGAEEEHIFPALRTELDDEALDAIRAAIRERRRDQYRPRAPARSDPSPRG